MHLTMSIDIETNYFCHALERIEDLYDVIKKKSLFFLSKVLHFPKIFFALNTMLLAEFA